MMKRYYIQIKANQKIKLFDAVIKHLKLNNAEAEKLIYQGSVWNSKQNLRLKDKDKILSDELIIINAPEFPIIEYTLSRENIKFEDEHFLIVYKEAGLNTCPSPLSDIDCLSHGIQKYYNEIKINYCVSTINRLDKPTKGLVFYAKNKKIEIFLHNMFKNHKVRKLYLSITPEFDLQKKIYLIHDQLQWKEKKFEAITYIKFLKEKNKMFYFFVFPLTGRTHQIRKHFLKYLKPIYGDALYGNYSRSDEMELLCFCYIFRHPVTKQKLKVEYLPEKYRC